MISDWLFDQQWISCDHIIAAHIKVGILNSESATFVLGITTKKLLQMNKQFDAPHLRFINKTKKGAGADSGLLPLMRIPSLKGDVQYFTT